MKVTTSNNILKICCEIFRGNFGVSNTIEMRFFQCSNSPGCQGKHKTRETRDTLGLWIGFRLTHNVQETSLWTLPALIECVVMVRLRSWKPSSTTFPMKKYFRFILLKRSWRDGASILKLVGDSVKRSATATEMKYAEIYANFDKHYCHIYLNNINKVFHLLSFQCIQKLYVQ